MQKGHRIKSNSTVFTIHSVALFLSHALYFLFCCQPVCKTDTGIDLDKQRGRCERMKGTE